MIKPLHSQDRIETSKHIKIEIESSLCMTSSLKICKKHAIEDITFPYCEKCNLRIYDQDLKNVLSPKDWKEEKCTVEFPIQSNGLLKFESWPSVTYAKYLRIKNSTLPESLITYMETVWKLERPDLVISVTGGSNDFQLPLDVKEAFKIGIMKAVKSTKAWIVTGGMNCGVMKLVGEAIADEMRTNNYVFLGITNWSVMKAQFNNRIADTNNYEQPIKYINSTNTVNLDPCHSHFILIDDNDSQQPEYTFRINLERHLTTPAGKMVLIVLNGALGTLETVDQHLKRETPILLLENSQGSADLIIQACSKNNSKSLEDLIDESDIIGKEIDRQNIFTIMTSIKNIWKTNPKLINVFRLDHEEDIETAILKTFINAPQQKLYDNLKLALLWNYHDVARKNILPSNAKLEPGQLEELFELALKLDRVEFVQLFLERNLELDKFLTRSRCKSLYNLKDSENNRLFLYLVTSYTNKTEIKDFKDSEVLRNILQELVNKIVSKDLLICFLHQEDLFKPESKDLFLYPAQNLFFWALLFNRIEIAKVFWRICDHQIINALFASKLLKEIPDGFQDHDYSFEQYSKDFEDAAIGTLNLMNDNSHYLISYCVLLRNVPFYNLDCLQMAMACNCKKFVSQPIVQQLFDSIWCGEMISHNFKSPKFVAKIGLSMLTVGILAPPLLFTKSTTTYPLDKEEQDFYDICTFKSYSKDIMERLCDETKLDPRKKPNFFKSYFHQYKEFYKAPLTHFAHDAVFFMFFLILFSYMMLCEFYYQESNAKSSLNGKIPWVDIVLIIWIISIGLEELRQFMNSGFNTGIPVKSVKKYFKMCLINYTQDGWNILDIIGLALFAIGTILKYIAIGHNSRDLFTVSRFILCIDLILWYSRALYYCSFFRLLGQIINILKNMRLDLLFFAILIFITSMAFGVVSQAVLYPKNKMDANLIKNVLHNSYWTFFGQLLIYNTVYNDDEFDDKSGTIFTFILLIVYVLVVVVLMNVLIAMFNSSFTNIYGNINVIWKYQRYYLTLSYNQYPFLPPPFNIIAYLINFIVWTVGKFNKKKKPEEKENTELDSLINYERQCVKKLFKKSEIQKKKKGTKKSCQLEKYVKEIYTELESIKADIQKMISSDL